jgi:hypothetical protein
LQTSPFIIASPEPVEDPEPSNPATRATQDALVAKILERIETIENPVGPSFEDVQKFIRHLENHHAFVDLIGGCFVRDPKIRLTILQTTSLTERLRLLLHSL